MYSLWTGHAQHGHSIAIKFKNNFHPAEVKQWLEKPHWAYAQAIYLGLKHNGAVPVTQSYLKSVGFKTSWAGTQVFSLGL